MWTTQAGAGVGFPPPNGHADVESGGYCFYFSGGGLLAVNCAGPCQTNTGYICLLATGCGPQFAGTVNCGAYVELDMLGPGNGTISDADSTAICNIGTLGAATSGRILTS